MLDALYTPPPLRNSGSSQLDPFSRKSWGSRRDSTYFSIANSTLVLPRLTLGFPVLLLVLPFLLSIAKADSQIPSTFFSIANSTI